MSYFYIDARRPRIDGATIYCPACGQSYDTITAGFIRLPPFHYPQPTDTSKKRAVVGVGSGRPPSPWSPQVCRLNSDDLSAHLFRTQVAAEQAQREEAA